MLQLGPKVWKENLAQSWKNIFKPLHTQYPVVFINILSFSDGLLMINDIQN